RLLRERPRLLNTTPVHGHLAVAEAVRTATREAPGRQRRLVLEAEQPEGERLAAALFAGAQHDPTCTRSPCCYTRCGRVSVELSAIAAGVGSDWHPDWPIFGAIVAISDPTCMIFGSEPGPTIRGERDDPDRDPQFRRRTARASLAGRPALARDR